MSSRYEEINPSPPRHPPDTSVPTIGNFTDSGPIFLLILAFSDFIDGNQALLNENVSAGIRITSLASYLVVHIFAAVQQSDYQGSATILISHHVFLMRLLPVAVLVHGQPEQDILPHGAAHHPGILRSITHPPPLSSVRVIDPLRPSPNNCIHVNVYIRWICCPSLS